VHGLKKTALRGNSGWTEVFHVKDVLAMSTVFAKIACSIGKIAKACRSEFRPLPLRFAEVLNKLADKECSRKDIEDNVARKGEVRRD
jgi:hypothetical protein